MIMAVTIPSFLKGNVEAVNLHMEVGGARGVEGRETVVRMYFFERRIQLQ